MPKNVKFVVSMLLAGAVLLLSGCELLVLNPAGDIARQQASLFWVATWLMLIVIVPVLILTAVIAWKYRASNREAEYAPEWHHSTTLEIIVWTIPLIIIIVLSGITFVATHRLDPYTPITRISEDKPLATEADILDIEVVALDWKWLFIYPELGIASINELAAPVDKQIRFKITSGSVMNSFYIPALAGQIYAMGGMQTKLHAVINEPGVYDGFSANYSGHGFSHMRFKFHGLDDRGFDQWIDKLRASGGTLDETQYLDLEKPSVAHPVVYFSNVQDALFHDILNLCVAGRATCADDMMAQRGQDQ